VQLNARCEERTDDSEGKRLVTSSQDAREDETSTCRYLSWDSEFFQRRIARADIERLTEESLRKVTDWCSLNRIDCLYLLAAADDPRTIRLLEASGFILVDIRTTLEMRIKGDQAVADRGRIRQARIEDIPILRKIAADSHGDSRFFSDGHFSEDKCRALYETWIEKSVNGWAKMVFVAELADQPVGYITCNVTADSGEIGLLGCSLEAQGQGLGSQLVKASLDWFREKGATEVTVVTQGRNVRAQRAYQRAGFVTRSVQLWFHYWPLG
jgi:dTDP-4-amino-4,6-dideoxy-D-galactose acyltransferase